MIMLFAHVPQPERIAKSKTFVSLLGKLVGGGKLGNIFEVTMQGVCSNFRSTHRNR